MNHQQVSTFLTASNIKFMLLHTGGKSDDNIKNFFQDVYELYVKVRFTISFRPCISWLVMSFSRGSLVLFVSSQFSMNPFYQYDTPIRSDAFETRVRAVARRYLAWQQGQVQDNPCAKSHFYISKSIFYEQSKETVMSWKWWMLMLPRYFELLQWLLTNLTMNFRFAHEVLFSLERT